MGSFKYAYLERRDGSDFTDNGPPYSMNQLPFVFFTPAARGFALLASLLLRTSETAGATASFIATTTPRTITPPLPSISNFNYGKNESVFVCDEKMNLIHNSSSPPTAVVPEIHITFPDEEGKAGMQQGRVVVVHVTDTGSVGMEPLNRENLPPYQKEDADRFQSLDLERIGGLREKESSGQRFS